MNPIAITRIAVHSALGTSLPETVDALLHERVGIRTPRDLEQTPRVDAGAGEVPLACAEGRAWRAEFLLRRALDQLLSPADHASIQAQPARWAAVIGTTLAGMRHCGAGIRADEASALTDADASYARTCASSVLAHAFRGSGIEGPTISVSCACASALTAVNHACSLLSSGIADTVVAGGYDPVSEFVYGGFSALQLVARGPLSPFALDREGMKLGEGAALFLLRRVADLTPVERSMAYGAIVGAGESSDAHHLTRPHPEGSGAARALRQALGDASEVHRAVPDLVVAHATGTAGNDDAEYAAYRSVFGAQLRNVPIVALKSRLGHPLGAAGVLEAALVIACARAGFVPTTAGNGRDRDAFPDLDLLEGPPRRGRPNDIVVLSAGFGGANAATRIVRELRSAGPRPSAARNSSMAVVSVGAVSPAGRGIAALVARTRDPAPWDALSECTLSPLLDHGRTRRLALLPRLMIAAVRDLADAAGLPMSELQSIPVLAANWCGAADFTERYYRDLVRGGIDLANPMLFAESVPNIGSAQCSLAFGVTAPSLSVIGRRTAALEAMLLAQARLASGIWRRAIVVAAEEEHPIVARTLSRCAGRAVNLRSAAVALLLESTHDLQESSGMVRLKVDGILGRTAPLAPQRACAAVIREAEVAIARTATLTSSSPFDDPAAALLPDSRRIHLAELGAATPLVAMLADERDAARLICCADPHGACWAARLRDAAPVW